MAAILFLTCWPTTVSIYQVAAACRKTISNVSALYWQDSVAEGTHMGVFENYARYYNVLYHDKNYAEETFFILSCLLQQGCQPTTILDLGCGTGRHALEMFRQNITVTGVDMSTTMLEMGRSLYAKMTPLPNGKSLPRLLEGDARNVRLHETFDAVTSLFHVMSYQNSEEDALAELETARIHLTTGGFFLFDFWYGPGVLTDPPTERDRQMEDEQTLVQRHAHPVHRFNDNIVEVHYSIALTDKSSGKCSHLTEMHSMRYWFLPELRYLAFQSGFTVAAEGAWLSFDAPTCNTWNAWMALKKC